MVYDIPLISLLICWRSELWHYYFSGKANIYLLCRFMTINFGRYFLHISQNVVYFANLKLVPSLAVEYFSHTALFVVLDEYHYFCILVSSL